MQVGEGLAARRGGIGIRVASERRVLSTPGSGHAVAVAAPCVRVPSVMPSSRRSSVGSVRAGRAADADAHAAFLAWTRNLVREIE